MKHYDTPIAANNMEQSLQLSHANISPCGSDCDACDCYKTMCNGCNSCEGKVFHSPEGCAIYQCAVHERNQKDCGSCKKLPCAIWKATRDPRYSDEEFEQNISQRMQTLTQFRKS